MSASSQPAARPPGDTRADASTAGPEQVGSSLPVPARHPAALQASAGAGALWRSPGLALPVVQALAAAAGGFFAGALASVLLGRRRRHAQLKAQRRASSSRRRRLRRGGASERAGELVQIVGSRSLLVDVHLLGQR